MCWIVLPNLTARSYVSTAELKRRIIKRLYYKFKHQDLYSHSFTEHGWIAMKK